MSSSSCFYCATQDSISQCEDCHLVSFCPHHRSDHRPSSKAKTACRPFKVIQDPIKGQCLVATRKIQPLELIISEPPAICAPYSWPLKRQCLECYKILINDEHCASCHYPVCPDTKCQKGQWHSIECEIFGKVGHRYGDQDDDLNAYVAIGTIRCLALKDTNPTLWESILTLRDHNADRRQADPNLWRESQEAKVVAFVVNVCKMVVGFPTKEKAQDLVHCVMGILATNSANLDLPSEGFGSGYALYPTYAKVNHSCYSNTKNLNHLPQHQLQLRSCKSIEAGEEICNQYVLPLSHTLARRNHLKRKWHFDCCCQRCSDPHELGSHLSTLLCPSCRGHLVSSDALNPFADWTCTTDGCGLRKGLNFVMECLHQAKEALKKNNQGEDIIQHYERFLYEQGTKFHPCHQVMIDVKLHLAVLYGNLRSYSLPSLTHPQKERKLQSIRDVLDTLDQVDAGYSSQRGKMLQEKLKTELCQAQQDFQSQKISQKTLEEILKRQKAQHFHINFLHQTFTKS